MKKLILLLALIISLLIFSGFTAIGKVKKYPLTFTILKSEYDKLFKCKVNTKVILPNNKYLDKAVIQRLTLVGSMKFLKLKLNYFSNAYLSIQVSDRYSTQIFLISGDKSVFYKGVLKKNGILMTKCAEDDIVSA